MEIITRIDAAKRGLKRYYTGKPCKHGHDSERWVYNGQQGKKFISWWSRKIPVAASGYVLGRM